MDEQIEILSDAIKEYYGGYELEELCSRFHVAIEYLGTHVNHRKLSAELMRKKSDTNHRRFLESILPKLLNRCEERILNTTWEVNVFDEHMLPQLKKLKDLLAGGITPDLQSQSANRFFTSPAEVADFLGSATTTLTIIDATLDKTIFDCMQKVRTPIRLMTGQGQGVNDNEIRRMVSAFRTRGIDIQIRRHVKLNDRFLILNGRCWMASCALAEVGRATLAIIECVDTKAVIVKEIGRKWREARV